MAKSLAQARTCEGLLASDLASRVPYSIQCHSLVTATPNRSSFEKVKIITHCRVTQYITRVTQYITHTNLHIVNKTEMNRSRIYLMHLLICVYSGEGR